MMTIKDIQKTSVKLADYSEIVIPPVHTEVTEEEIQASINKAREQAIVKIEKAGPANKYDEVWIDLSGKAGQISFPATPVQDYPVVIGTRGFYEGIENKLIGTKIGDILQCIIDMPGGMLPAECGTNLLEVTVKVKKIFAYELPPLDDAFVAKVSPCTTIAEFKEYIKAEILKKKESAKLPVKQNKALAYMLHHSVVELESHFISEKAKELKDSFAVQLKEANCTFEQYLEHASMTIADYEERALRDAKNILSGSCILYQIAEKENLQPSIEEIDREVARLDYSGMVGVSDLKKHLSSEDMEKIVFTARLQMASMFLSKRVKEAE
ncbi:MAG: hypothetical protein MRZ59_07420 [Clostridiales bacterium]|nr:hypothetical protein [Clostridiales bacterium]MDY3745569.1 hypothetical protein [Lachnospiraceae bacterium]